MESQEKKLGFFRKVLMSIKDFEKYDVFLKENIGQAFLYLIKIMLIYSILVTVLSTYSFATNLNKVFNRFNEQVESLKYEEGTLTINDNKKIEISDLSDEIGVIVVNTMDLSDDEIEQEQSKIQSQGNGILVLKDKIIVLNNRFSTNQEIELKTVFGKYQIDSLDKQTVVDYYNQNNITILISATMVMFVYIFVIYSFNALIDALALGILAYLTAKIVRVAINFVGALNISIHALTLPLMLNMIYIIVNFFTGFTIKYFQIMYTAIAYIYIITVILMLKSDLIKGLEKIKEVQERVKEEIKQREEEQREKDEVKKKDKESEKENKKDKKEDRPKPRIGNNPEGDNA